MAAGSLLLPLAVAAFTVPRSAAEVYTPRPGTAPAVRIEPGLPPYDPAKPTAVVVLGEKGTNVADTLPPYEVLAATGGFNVYTVAVERRPVPLNGAADLVPDVSFTGLAELLPSTPDVIVVPQLQGEAPGGPVVRWLQEQDRLGDPLMVSVCVGAEILADAGLLDGRPATSHWLKLIGLRRDFPGVEWRDDVRYVEDGQLITTAGVLSGVDGALRVVERLAGSGAAQRAAADVQWPHYSPDRPAPVTPVRPAPTDLIGLLSAAYRWDRPTMGVLLTEGVGETELASALRPYTELSYLARPYAVSADGSPVRTRHGLTVLPRADLVSARSRLDTFVVPGAAAAYDRQPLIGLPAALEPVYLHDQRGFAFDGALRHIARTEDSATARWVAKTLHYPLPPLDGSEPAWPWALVARPLLLAAGAAAVVALLGWRRPRRPPSGS